MTYEEALTYIHSVCWKGSIPGLSRTQELLAKMGNPEKNMKYVHITGTNGKGSTAAMTASILRKAGYQTGLYTSPFLWRFNERMNVNGCDISDEELAEITAEIKPLAESMREHPTEFELVTAIGFAYFARHKCDIVVLEVGMGGALDSTNVIPAPEAAVITNIGLDHTEYLGSTFAQIAETKSGIVKPGCQAVLYPSRPDVEDVVSRVCREKGVGLRIADFGKIHSVSRDFSGQVFDYGPYQNIHLPLLGEHQLRNCAVVLETIQALRQQGWVISYENLYEGIRDTIWPGRFELLRRDPIFIVDGGHNPQCLEALAENVREYLADREIVALTGVMADKDYTDMYAEMAPLIARFVTVTPDNPRAMQASDLAKFLKQFGKPAQAAPTVEQGVLDAMELAGKDGVVLAFGSLYMTGAIRETVKNRM